MFSAIILISALVNLTQIHKTIGSENMKKLGVILLTTFLIVSMTACGSFGNNDSSLTTTYKISDMVNSNNETGKVSEEITNTESYEENIGGDDYICNHEYYYHTIDGCFISYVDKHSPGWFDKFVDMFGRTEDCNIRFFADYFGIRKENFWSIVGSNASDFGIDYADFYNTDRWYADDYATNGFFITDDNPAPDSGSIMIRPENDTIHTDRYFTIHKSLIDFVGEERFNEFKEKYGGTEYFNVLNFIDYFNISRESFEICMEEQRKTSFNIYNVDYVYGTEEQQKMYFEKHIIEVKE